MKDLNSVFPSNPESGRFFDGGLTRKCSAQKIEEAGWFEHFVSRLHAYATGEKK